MTATAIVVAAGRGARAGTGGPKQYRLLQGRPVLAWSVRAFHAAAVSRIVVVIAPEHAGLCRAALGDCQPTEIVHGGETRTASVRAGLNAAGEADIVLVHDAARPGLRPTMVRALVGAVEGGAAAVAPALATPDSLVRTDGAGNVIAEVDRTHAVRVQTPQAFDAKVLRAAYAALPAEATVDDDLAVVRAAGVQTHVIKGDQRLMKLTYEEDFTVLQSLMSDERILCVGNGVDAHRFGAGDHVTLCGVRIAHSRGLLGHSDADAGWHALVDAILGALCQGDIGAHFPPRDPVWSGADSEHFLRHAAQLAHAAGARILHADVTLLCEQPKIGAHRDAMRARTAAALGLAIDRVSVKATTTEGMGFLGREEGLAAQATATLDRPA